MYRWLDAGAIGQAAIAVTAAAVITVANETKNSNWARPSNILGIDSDCL